MAMGLSLSAARVTPHRSEMQSSHPEKTSTALVTTTEKQRRKKGTLLVIQRSQQQTVLPEVVFEGTNDLSLKWRAVKGRAIPQSTPSVGWYKAKGELRRSVSDPSLTHPTKPGCPP